MVLVLVVIILLIIWLAVLKKRIFTKVYHYLNVEDYDNFFKCVDSRLARMMIPIYMREYYKLNAYIKMDDYQNVTKQFNYLMKLNLNSYQLNSILISGFNYYCYQNDKKKCRKILDKMKEVFFIFTQIKAISAASSASLLLNFSALLAHLFKPCS